MFGSLQRNHCGIRPQGGLILLQWVTALMLHYLLINPHSPGAGEASLPSL